MQRRLNDSTGPSGDQESWVRPGSKVRVASRDRVPSPSHSDRRLEGIALLLAILTVVASLLLAHGRDSWRVVAGDESTFLAMAESLSLDGDLRFTVEDRERLEAADSAARKSVILQRAGKQWIFYSKPVLYPLLAAPAYRLFGRAGMTAFNALAVIAALWLFWVSVRRTHERGAWALTIVTFAAAGAVLAQIAWTTSDALQMALAMAGGTLALRNYESRWWRVVGPLGAGLLLGFLISMRLPNALLVLAVVGAVALSGRLRGAVWLGAGAMGGFAIAYLLAFNLVIGANPYRAERATFNVETGYPVGEGSERAREQFVAGRATQRLGVVPSVRPRTTAYAGLYFLGGRHTGLLIYLPAALILFGTALGGGRARLALLAGAAATAVFYLIWMPENYFGGAAFVGNRYFLPAYGLLLPALRRPPKTGLLIGVWALSGVLFYWAFESIQREQGRPYSSQSHAYAGAFRLFPYESTALAIETREDRYYSDEFLRFTDRNARSGEHGFHLTSGAPPAEILLATPRPSGILRFLALVDRPEATLVYRDWRGQQRVELEPHPEGARGLVEIVAAPAWRRHGFWWTDEPWRAHSIRLSLEAAGEPGGEADLRYLGPYRLASKFFAYEVMDLKLPELALAGSTETLVMTLINRGLRPWRSDADVPIHLSHRIEDESEGGSAPPAAAFTEISETVDQDQQIELRVELVWPAEVGRYRLLLDLTAGGVEPFAGWVGTPLAAGSVEVVAPE